MAKFSHFMHAFHITAHFRIHGFNNYVKHCNSLTNLSAHLRGTGCDANQICIIVTVGIGAFIPCGRLAMKTLRHTSECIKTLAKSPPRKKVSPAWRLSQVVDLFFVQLSSP